MKKHRHYISIIHSIVYLFLFSIIIVLVINKNNSYIKTANDNTSMVVKSLDEVNDLKTAINNIYDATVYIEVSIQTSNRIGINTSLASGSGFIYKKDDKYGYIITNYHVVNGASKIVVTFSDGSEVDATLLGSDEFSDIAILRVDQSHVLQVAELGTSSNVEIGDTLFTVGAPLGKDYMGTITKGILSGKNRMVEVELSSGSFLMDTLQTDASINSGNSGGPLCNILGQVIGVNSSKLIGDGVEGMGFAIPIDSVIPIINDLEVGKRINRPYLGIQMIDIATLYNSQYRYNININSDLKNGIVLTFIEDGKPASKAGLQEGDIITKLDDEMVIDTSHFRYMLYKHKINDSVKVEYYRDNKINDTTIKLTESIGN